MRHAIIHLAVVSPRVSRRSSPSLGTLSPGDACLLRQRSASRHPSFGWPWSHSEFDEDSQWHNPSGHGLLPLWHHDGRDDLNRTTTANATAAGDAVTSLSPTVTANYVSGVAENVELRPADEGVNQLLGLCAQLKTRTSGVVVLSNLTVGVTYTVTCKACNDVCNSILSAASDPILASTWANLPYFTEVEVTEDVELTLFLGAASNGGSVVTGYVALVPR